LARRRRRAAVRTDRGRVPAAAGAPLPGPLGGPLGRAGGVRQRRARRPRAPPGPRLQLGIAAGRPVCRLELLAASADRAVPFRLAGGASSRGALGAGRPILSYGNSQMTRHRTAPFAVAATLGLLLSA